MVRKGGKTTKTRSGKVAPADAQSDERNLSAKHAELLTRAGSSTDADSLQEALQTLPPSEHMNVLAKRAETQGSLHAKGGVLMQKSIGADPWSDEFMNDFTEAMVRGLRLNITPSKPVSAPYLCRHPMLQRDSTGGLWIASGAIAQGQLLVEEPCFFVPHRDGRHNLRPAGAAMLYHCNQSSEGFDGFDSEAVVDPAFSCAPIWSLGSDAISGLSTGAQFVCQPWETAQQALRMWQWAAKECANVNVHWDRDGKSYEFFPMQGALPHFAHSCKPNAAWIIAEDFLRVVSTRPIQQRETICVRISPDWGHGKGNFKCSCGLSKSAREELWKQECIVVRKPSPYSSTPLPGVMVKVCGGSMELRGRRGTVVGMSRQLVEVDFKSPVGRRQVRAEHLCATSADDIANSTNAGANEVVPYDAAVLLELQMMALVEDRFGKAGDATGIALGTVTAGQRLQWLHQWSMQLNALPRVEETWAIASSDLPGASTMLTVFHGRRDLKKTKFGNFVRESRIMVLAFNGDATAHNIISAFRGAAAAPAVGEPRLPAGVVFDYALRRHETCFREATKSLGIELRVESKEEVAGRLRHVKHSGAGQRGCFFSSHRPCANVGCNKEGVSLCSQCAAVHYCSTTCRNNHWLLHKKICRQKEPLTVAKPVPGSPVVAVALVRAPELNGLHGTVLEPSGSDSGDRLAIDFGSLVGSKALRLLNVLPLPLAEIPPVIFCVLPCSIESCTDFAGVRRCLESIASQSQQPSRLIIPWSSSSLEHREGFRTLLSAMDNVLDLELPDLNSAPLKAISAALEHFRAEFDKYEHCRPWLIFSEQSGIWHPDRISLYHSTLVRSGAGAAAGADIVSILGGRYAQPRCSPAHVTNAADIDELIRTDRAFMQSVFVGDAKAKCGLHCDDDLWGSCVRLSSVRDFIRSAPPGVLAHEIGDVALQSFSRHCGIGAGRNGIALPVDDPEAKRPMWIYFLDWDGSGEPYGPTPKVTAAEHELANAVLARLSAVELRRTAASLAEQLPGYLARVRHNIESTLLRRVVVTDRRLVSDEMHTEIIDFAVSLVKGGLAEKHWRFAALALFRRAADDLGCSHNLKD